MFGRRPLRAVAVALLVVVGCSSPPAPEPPRNVPRPTIARRELPPEVAPRVPRHGVYLAGGGEKSPAFRVVVDTDQKTIYTGTAAAGSPIHGAMTTERTRELTPANEQHLMRLCADAWSEPAPARDPDPVAGYDEVLVIADGEELFFLRGNGPITRPAAARAVEALRAAAAL